MVEWLIKPVIDAAVAKSLDVALETLLSRHVPNMGIIDEHLARMDQNLEKLLTIHLKAGFTFLRIGQFEKARDEFVKAEAVDGYAAVAKFWLGLVLGHLGQADFAIEKCSEALLINPFVAPSLVGEHIKLELERSPIISILHPWTLCLTDEGVLKRFEGLSKRQLAKYRKTNTALRQVSCNGAHAVVLWSFDMEYFSVYERDMKLSSWPRDAFLSAFSILQGECLWHKPVKGIELICATPDFVVIRTTANGRYGLLDIATGTTKTDMSEPYFGSVFSSVPLPNEMPNFAGANKRMLLPEIALKKCKEIAGGDALVFREKNADYLESTTVQDPFGSELGRFCAANTWHYRSFGGSSTTMGNSSLSCDSKIAVYQKRSD